MHAIAQFWRDPAMPYVESRRACDSRACYRPHSHPTFSVGAVDRGRSVFSGATQSPVVLRPGSVVFVPPACVHACNPEPGNAWSYQMLHVDAHWWQTLRQEAAAAPERPPVDEPVRVSRVPADYVRFCCLNSLLFSDASVHEKEAALIEFVCDYGTPGDRLATRAQRRTSSGPRIQPVLDALRCGQADASLSELAALARMSRYQLIRAFRDATGLTPHAWQTNQRINQARERLRAGHDIARVAHDLGFSDQSHFQRVFKAYTGVTPGSYRP
ncbi:AraC family transcriptional regulator [Burkholderia sp. TSV86]|nr:AraC family transcriptional regulator [Burkholderia sp. TSV86]